MPPREHRRDNLPFSGISFPLLCHIRRHVNGFADTRIRSAAAEIAGHGIVDVGVRWVGIGGEQGGGAHHLSRLAITALRNLYLKPRLLHWMRAVGGQAFDGGDALACDCADGRHARPHCIAIDVDRTRAAKSHAAAELRACQSKLLAQRPKKRHCRIDIQFFWIVVNAETNRSHAKSPPEPRRTFSLILLVRYEPNSGASMTATLEDVTNRPYSLFPYFLRIEHLLCLNT